MAEDANQNQANPEGVTDSPENKGVENQDKTQKTFTQDDVDKIVSKRLGEEKAKTDARIKEAVQDALAEKERQSKLSDEEKANEALKQRNAEIDEREKAITLRERRSDALTKLVEKKIPTDLVDFVVDLDEEKTSSNIDKLTDVWKKAVDEAAAEQLKHGGETPKDRSTSGNKPTGTGASANGVIRSGHTSTF